MLTHNPDGRKLYQKVHNGVKYQLFAPPDMDPFILVTYMDTASESASYEHTFRHELSPDFKTIDQAKAWIEDKIKLGDNKAMGGIMISRQSPIDIRKLREISIFDNLTTKLILNQSSTQFRRAWFSESDLFKDEF